ncbi:MAG TPA: hypothetical protein VGD31_10245 [Sphingobacteriaceae bacterium]
MDIDTWVSAEFQRLAEIVNEYDHHLFLEWIPPDKRESLYDKTKTFRIVDDRNNKVVLWADSISNPKEILARLWSMDLQRGDVVGRMDAENRAAQVIQLKERLDEMEAAKDLSAFVIKNTKSRWTHNGRVYDDEFRDQGPVRKVVE